MQPNNLAKKFLDSVQYSASKQSSQKPNTGYVPAGLNPHNVQGGADKSLAL
jgi:hypothetical protein